MKNAKISSNKSFGIVFFAVFFLISFWSFRGDFDQIKIFPLIISIIFLLLGLINSKFLSPLNKLWVKFGLLLGSIIAPIIMMFIFFLVLTPISFIMKMLGKDLMGIKYNDNKSYWINRNKTVGTMKKQF